MRTDAATAGKPAKRAPVESRSMAPGRAGRLEVDACPVVGVGASAGGLEAFSSLLAQLGARPGIAVVLIQHLDPTHASFLRDALVKTTTMKIELATQDMRVEPDHVYVIPPNTFLGISGGRLTISPRADDPRVQHLPIDFFFRQLVVERGSRAIGVILSGTASDGTEGLKAIKDADGLTFVQEPASAKFPGMPQSAVDAGVVDVCLPVPELAREILRLVRHPYVASSEAPVPAGDAATLKEIFGLVQATTRLDFSEYKAPTFERRLARRMALRRVETLPAYLAFLRAKPEEVTALYEDALIHVTSFFRDPELFESLKTKVFPAIVKDKADGAPIRVWVAGCATGEEVYSLGIALVEFLGDSSRPVQLFGSDVSTKAIEAARAGLYPDSAVRGMTDERRRRFFTKMERGYRIAKSVRDRCVFVQHDLARDPPFSKLDLVSCRNVLIYFDLALQKRVVPTFHYALAQPGFLVLGRAESISGFKQLFEAVDKTNKIFARTAVASTLRFAKRSEAQRSDPPRPAARPARGAPTRGDLTARLDRLLLGRYAPPGIVVDERMEILEFRGETGPYLRPAPGEPQNNAMQMARGGLAMTLRASVAAAKKSGVSVRAAGVEVDQDEVARRCDLVVIPLLSAPAGAEALYVVLFEEPSHRRPGAKERSRPPGRETRLEKGRVPRLEQELAATKEYLQNVIADHGRTNEELGSANEELVSGNEELQSMNEELETAKEELQSINEELTTVNDELHARNQEMNEVNSDLVNLLTTVDVPILILDSEHRIRRFTPKARSILNVVAGDVGRPFADLRPNIDVADLGRQIAEVIETVTVRESEVLDRDGHWHRLQIRPYKTTDNRIDGAVISLFDIDALKHHLTQVERANSDAARESHTKDDFLATLSHELRTPLSSMLMRAQMLRQGGMEDAKVRRAGEALENGVRLQVQLIDDLLDVSRIISGKLTMSFHPVDVGSIVARAIDGLSGAALRKSMTVRADVAVGDATARVLADDVRLHQIFTNLLANAIKFTPAHGTITVSIALGQDTAVVKVRDTGIGIAPDFLPTIFNRFTQENTTSTRAYGGLGLGLAIVRHLVELHHGTVVAESAGPDQGATFTVSLPLLQVGRAAVDALAARPAPLDLTVLAGRRILLVDDDAPTRDVIAELLARTGAQVRVAASAREGMKAMGEFAPELLICDVAMPGEDGYAFIRKVRSLQPGTIPALALTALAHEDDRERALAAGFQIHLAKPVDIERLTRALLELVASRGTVPPLRGEAIAPA